MKQKLPIVCPICGESCHVMEVHLKNAHPYMSIEEFQRRFPDSPIMSEYAMEERRKALDAKDKDMKEKGVSLFHNVFGLDREKCLSTVAMKPIPVTVRSDTKEFSDLIPTVDKNYVFNITELKYVMSGVEMNIPIYIYGHKGGGKTELVEQICARTKRPLLRVQHTVNMEESQIVGQWIVKDGETQFSYGPLPLAMINGWSYLADEYDFAMPNVLSVYQAVLEGKPLMIKEAPENMRIVRPNPNFRFFATGNTNGTGDDTGLYQGTTIQNSANYDRFGVVVKKEYLTLEDEIKILTKRTIISKNDAEKMASFAKQVRDAFDAGKIGDTISPRTLLFATKLGIAHASFPVGIQLAFLNKLSDTDKMACSEYVQRYFGVLI